MTELKADSRGAASTSRRLTCRWADFGRKEIRLAEHDAGIDGAAPRVLTWRRLAAVRYLARCT